MSLTRRRLLLASGLLPLAGCGFQPVYMPTASGKAGPAARELAAITVPVIPERQGQLLRQALQERFANDSGTTPQIYDLSVSLTVLGEPIAIQQSSLATRMRLTGTASYVLTVKSPWSVVSRGSARVVDNFNLLDQQFFAAEMENEAVVRRMTDALADQITAQLAMFFRKRANG